MVICTLGSGRNLALRKQDLFFAPQFVFVFVLENHTRIRTQLVCNFVSGSFGTAHRKLVCATFSQVLKPK